ncbi:hypothetical protein [Bordetella ansorpii]|nr:hypothetical protein [Bordetella ansorpii]
MIEGRGTTISRPRGARDPLARALASLARAAGGEDRINSMQ